MDPSLATLVARLLGRPVTLVGSPLASSSRNVVQRVATGDRTFIAKRRLTSEPSPEGPALRALTGVGSDVTPQLIAADEAVTVMADLGEHPHLASFLLGSDPLRHVRFSTSLDVLSAGDMCPDNNLVDGGVVRFIDLEFATVRHLAWDLAYLFVPWPSCWCAWQLPDGLAQSAVGEWRRTFAPADWRSLGADVELAADAWRWLSVSWLLPSLATGWPVREDRPAPPVADRIVHSLDALSSSSNFTQLSDTAGELAAAVRARFDVSTLAEAAAWR